MKVNPSPGSLEYGLLATPYLSQELRFVKRGIFMRIVALIGLFLFMVALSLVSTGLMLSRGLSGKR